MRIPVPSHRRQQFSWLLIAVSLSGVMLLPVSAESQGPLLPGSRVPDPVEIIGLPKVPATVAKGRRILIPPVPTRDIPAAPQIAVPPPPVSRSPVSDPKLKSQNSVLPAVPAIPVQSQPVESVVSRERAPDTEWSITITPMEKEPVPSLASRYEAVYKSIPFRRSEYLANPSYRHDTTVEILFGQMRQTVIQRNDTPQRVVNPRPQLTQPYPISKGELYSYWPLLQYSYPLPLLSPIQ